MILFSFRSVVVCSYIWTHTFTLTIKHVCVCLLPVLLDVHFPEFSLLKVSCDTDFFFASLSHFLDTGVCDPFRENDT